MKYLDEFRDPVAAKSLVEAIRRGATRPWTIMEVCGGQTHSIIRTGSMNCSTAQANSFTGRVARCASHRWR